MACPADFSLTGSIPMPCLFSPRLRLLTPPLGVRYMVSEVPYPFTSREQYERSLRQPIGGEWNTSQSVRAMTRPAVVVRAGVAVNPMKLGKLHRDNAKDGSAGGVVSAKGAKGGAGEGKARGGAGRRRGSKAGPKGS